MREQRVEVGRRGSVRREQRREDRHDDEAEYDDEAGDRHRATQEPLAQNPPAPRAGLISATASTALTCRDADARVEQRVDDVDEQVDDDVARRRDEHDALDQRVVALVHGLDRQPAEAGDAEDRLRDDRTGDERAELEADQRRDRDQAVAERVPADDLPLAQPLRARGAHVVGAERVEHRRAHLAHQHGGESPCRARSPA